MTRRPRGPAWIIAVDASVAQAAGEAGAVAARAVACREAFTAIWDAGLWVAMPPDLFDEWRRHWSRYARKWLHQMTGGRRVDRDPPAPDEKLRRSCAANLQAREQQAVEKDLPLIETALAKDHRVVSLDEEVRVLLRRLAATVRHLAGVLWASPEADGCVAWLSDGAPPDARWELRPPDAPHPPVRS